MTGRPPGCVMRGNCCGSGPSSVPSRPSSRPCSTFRRSVYGRPCYFHTSDLDGRHFESDEDNPALWQLGVTRRHLLVLDATVVPRVRDRIGLGASGGTTPRPAWTETSVATAERPYRLLVTQLGPLGAAPQVLARPRRHQGRHPGEARCRSGRPRAEGVAAQRGAA